MYRLVAIRGVCVKRRNGLCCKPHLPSGCSLLCKWVNGGMVHSQRSQSCLAFQNIPARWKTLAGWSPKDDHSIAVTKVYATLWRPMYVPRRSADPKRSRVNDNCLRIGQHPSSQKTMASVFGQSDPRDYCSEPVSSKQTIMLSKAWHVTQIGFVLPLRSSPPILKFWTYNNPESKN